MKKNFLGDIIFACRKKLDLNQTDFGARYEISGPAIHKFEKSYVKPSLKTWLRIAKDAGISERPAVLLWVKRMLPEPLRDYVEVQSAATLAADAQAGKKTKAPDYAKLATPEALAAQIANDKTMPSGLRELVMDNELRALYALQGKEINQLRDMFGPLGRGSKELFRDALRILREFTEAA